MSASPKRPARPTFAQWLQFVLGAPLVQISCAIVAGGSFAFARFLDQGPNDPPKPLVAGILAIGVFPIIAVGMMRGGRTFRDRAATGTASTSAARIVLALLPPLAALAGVIALAAS
jgi:hypothetical protein